jgi:antitoxin MazE
MRVTKWGNSLGVRLPKQIVEDMGLRAGDELRVVKTIDGTLAIDVGRRREQAAAERAASPPIRRPRKTKSGRA